MKKIRFWAGVSFEDDKRPLHSSNWVQFEGEDDEDLMPVIAEWYLNHRERLLDEYDEEDEGSIEDDPALVTA